MISFKEDADSRQNLGMSGIIQQNTASFGAFDYPAGGYPIYASAFGMSHIRGLWPDAFTTATSPYIWRYIKPLIAGLSNSNPGFLQVLTPSGPGAPSPFPSPVATELGIAAKYALLGYSGITNTGNTVVTGGDIGAGTGSTAITGFPPGVVTPPAVIDQTDVAAAQVALAAAILFYQNLLPAPYAISSVASSVGSTAVYTGVFPGGAANGLVGVTLAVTGFVAHVSNNGTFLVTASTATTVTLANSAAVAETISASATQASLSDLSIEGNGSTTATYTPGNYFSVAASSLTMPTGIILDAQGNPNAVFVFVAGSTINLAGGQSVTLINGAQAANVVFVAGSSITTVATSTMNGNLLAVASVTLGGGTLNGRALANNGAVTIAAATAVTSPLVGTIAGGPLVEVPAGTNFTGTIDLLAYGY